jgi:hypothetical protein
MTETVAWAAWAVWPLVVYVLAEGARSVTRTLRARRRLAKPLTAEEREYAHAARVLLYERGIPSRIVEIAIAEFLNEYRE